MAEKKYTPAQLKKISLADLKKILEDEGYEVETDWLKADYVEFLADIDAPDEDEADDDEADDAGDGTETEESDEVDEVDDEEEDDVELPDEEEVDEVEAPAAVVKKTRTTKAKAKAAPAEGEEATIAAKQVATILGTEAKTLRQFFRSTASTIEPVGSGGRYEFNESDVPQIKAEFDAWKAGHASRGNKRTGEGSTKRSRGSKAVEVVEIEEVEELEIEDEDLEDEDLELDE